MLEGKVVSSNVGSTAMSRSFTSGSTFTASTASSLSASYKETMHDASRSSAHPSIHHWRTCSHWKRLTPLTPTETLLKTFILILLLILPVIIVIITITTTTIISISSSSIITIIITIIIIVRYTHHHACTCPPVYRCVYLELVHTWLGTGLGSIQGPWAYTVKSAARGTAAGLQGGCQSRVRDSSTEFYMVAEQWSNTQTTKRQQLREHNNAQVQTTTAILHRRLCNIWGLEAQDGSLPWTIKLRIPATTTNSRNVQHGGYRCPP